MAQRKTAMKVRIDLAFECDPADLESVLSTSKRIEALKAEAKELGFVQIEASAKLGSIEAADETPQAEAAEE